MPTYRAGQRVLHSMFGPCTVLKDGPGSRVKVKFDRAEEKVLDLNLAPMRLTTPEDLDTLGPGSARCRECLELWDPRMPIRSTLWAPTGIRSLIAQGKSSSGYQSLLDMTRSGGLCLSSGRFEEGIAGMACSRTLFLAWAASWHQFVFQSLICSPRCIRFRSLGSQHTLAIERGRVGNGWRFPSDVAACPGKGPGASPRAGGNLQGPGELRHDLGIHPGRLGHCLPVHRSTRLRTRSPAETARTFLYAAREARPLALGTFLRRG